MKNDPMFRFYCPGVEADVVERVLENLSNGSFVLWKRVSSTINLSIVCEGTVQHRTLPFSKQDTIERVLKGVRNPLVTLGVCAGNLSDRNPLSSFSIKLIQVPWMCQTEEHEQDAIRPISLNEDLERKLQDSSTELVSSTHGARRREEKEKLILCLDNVIEQCLAQAQRSPKHQLNPSHSETQQLLEVVDSILQHGFDVHGMYGEEDKRTWWDFVKSALDLDPQSRRGSDTASRMGTSLTNQMVIKTLRKLSTLKSKLKSAKYKTGYPWILISLQHEQLHGFFRDLANNTALVNDYYSPLALIRDSEKWAQVVEGIEHLKS